MHVVVYYDDLWDDSFGRDSKDKLEAAVAVADQLLSEKQTLGTMFEINIVDVLHAEGHKWEAHESMIPEPSNCMKKCITCEALNECGMKHCDSPPVSAQGLSPPSQECLNCQMSDDAKNCMTCIMDCMEAGEGPIVKGLALSA